MKLIVGLGNPGNKYKDTRHNVGWLVLDKLKQAISKSEFLCRRQENSFDISKQSPIPNFQFEKKFNSEVASAGGVVLAKPQTFMNNSGIAVSSLCSYYKIQTPNLYIIHDDLDLRLGEYKIQKGVGPKLHYGLQSIENKLGSRDFWRARVGVDNRDLENRISGEAYVLQKFPPKEKEVFDAVTDKLLASLIDIISK